ncbi:hypothetical protein CcaCcLH18_13677 [Colletotrichum camelliae]|nr:hypothetical protein CcaCcLH18_13677 [Colletotrichum camelliae]
MSSDNSNNQQPGLVAGHAEYIKGAAEMLTSSKAAIGNITGSHAWQSSGEQDKAHAASTMKAAGQQRDASAQGYGKAEETAGKVFGCDGMKAEGAASKAPEVEDNREIRRA